MNASKIVMFDSDEAAHKVTVTGWVSRLGHFYGDDERGARYQGCTHAPCSTCGEPAERGYTACASCRHKNKIARYDAMPRKEWDGTACLYSESADRYFNDMDEIEYFLEDDGGDIEGLRLIICEPLTGRQLDHDYFCDELAEDGELPDDLAEAVDVFNKAIIAAGTLSWTPGKYALTIAATPAAGQGEA